MTVALTVEGPIDKGVFKKVLGILTSGGAIPVRAGYGPFQGEAILDRLEEIVRQYPEEKIIFIVDANKAVKAKKILTNATAPHGKIICLLVAPWRGSEDFVENHLPDSEVGEFQRQRRRGKKSRLAELFLPRLSPEKISQDAWLKGEFMNSVKCQCPKGSIIS